MRERRLAAAAAVVVAGAAAAALLVALVPGRSAPVTAPPQGIGARASLERAVLFGDTVHASVDVMLDRRVVEPSSLRLDGSFGDYSQAGPPSVERADVGPATRIRFGISLLCQSLQCLPRDPTHSGPRVFQFAPLRIDYRRVGGRFGSLEVGWPPLSVGSRVTPAEMRLLTPIGQPPFHVDMTPPPPTYRISPTLLVALLCAVGGVLLAAAGLLAVRFAPRPRVGVEPEPAPPEPLVELTPLERALLLLERARERGGVAEQRKALEHLAGELRRVGSCVLAGTATVLAWAERPPAVDETRALAAAVERSLAARGNGDGRPS